MAYVSPPFFDFAHYYTYYNTHVKLLEEKLLTQKKPTQTGWTFFNKTLSVLQQTMVNRFALQMRAANRLHNH